MLTLSYMQSGLPMPAHCSDAEDKHEYLAQRHDADYRLNGFCSIPLIPSVKQGSNICKCYSL